MAFWHKKSDSHYMKTRSDDPKGGPIGGGNIASDGNGKDPTRGVPGAILSGAGATNDRTRAVTQAMSHPSVIAPVLFFATEFGRMPYVLKSGGEEYDGGTPNWMKRPLPKNPSYVWRRFQREAGFEMELFGGVGLRVDTNGVHEDGGHDITSVRLVSARRFAVLGEVDDPSYLLFPPAAQTVNTAGQVQVRQGDKAKYEELRGEPNDDGVFFLHATSMTAADELDGVSAYLLGASMVRDASFARLQKSRFWQRDGRRLFALKGIDPSQNVAGDKWKGLKKEYKKSLKIQQDEPADVPLFAKTDPDVLHLDDTMKNSQGVEFAEYFSSQLAMLGRIPEMLIRMGHRSNPNYKIIRAIYQFFISSRVAPALNDFAAVLQQLMPPGVDISFDVSDALRADLETLVQTFRLAKGLPLWSGDEMRDLAGFDESGMEEMMEYFVDIQTMPIERIDDLADSMVEKNYGLGAKAKDRAEKAGTPRGPVPE